MTSHFEKVQEIVLGARAQPGESRSAWLDEACGGDVSLRSEVDSLLEHDQPTDARLQTGGVIDWEEPAPPPERIGPFHLQQKLGEGGFGEVFVAEQTEPLRRKVAIKVLKRGMDTRSVLARFAAEGQALALMEHPNVARILDAGETETGLPYFVMDWIRGRKITAHADAEKLSIRDRLEMFLAVCSAVEHAHSKGIIHRDVKPSNILVAINDGTPTPKVIDFGIAKALASPLTDRTLFTAAGQVLGTPAYMSPEQASTGTEITPASDVYSLGAVLYELLVGVPPHDPKLFTDPGTSRSRGTQWDRAVALPSDRYSRFADDEAESVATARSASPRNVRQELRAGVDWIVVRALELEPGKRYPSAHEMAEDIRRFLSGQQVEAAPAHPGARLGRRARLVLSHAGTRATDWVGRVGIAVSNAVQAQRIAEDRDRARRELQRAERVSDFLAETLATVEPSALGTAIVEDLKDRVRQERLSRGQSTDDVEALLEGWQSTLEGVNPTDSALQLLDEQILARAGRMIDEKLGDEPEIAARMRATFGITYRDLGLYDKAEPYLRESLRQRRAVFGPDHAETISSLNALSRLLLEQERFEEAERSTRDTLKHAERALSRDHPETLLARANLGSLLLAAGRMDEAEAVRRESAEEHLRVHGEESRETANAVGNLGVLFTYRGNYEEAEPVLRQSYEIFKKTTGPHSPETLTALGNISHVLEQKGKAEEAEEICRDIVAACRHVHGDGHYDTSVALINLGAILDARKRHGEAADCFREARDGLARTVGPEHSRTLGANHNLGCSLKAMGHLEEAEPLLAQGLEKTKEALGPDHMHTLIAMGHYGELLRLQGRLEEADAVLQDSVERAERTLQPSDWLRAIIWVRSGQCQADLGRNAHAEDLFLRAYELYSDALGEDHHRTQAAADELATLFKTMERPDEAAKWSSRGTPGVG